jgi:hypothetical protein
MGPGDLNKAICDLPQMSDPRLIRGLASPDDAGVYQISDDLAIIQTVDFFTPIVDDPYTFGQIAVANSLSACRRGLPSSSPASYSSSSVTVASRCSMKWR